MVSFFFVQGNKPPSWSAGGDERGDQNPTHKKKEKKKKERNREPTSASFPHTFRPRVHLPSTADAPSAIRAHSGAVSPPVREHAHTALSYEHDTRVQDGVIPQLPPSRYR